MIPSPFLNEKALVAKLVNDLLNIRQDIIVRLENVEEAVEKEVEVPQEVIQSIIEAVRPVVGTDYYTEEEKWELVQTIYSLIQVPKVGVDFFTVKEKREFMAVLKDQLSRELQKAIQKIPKTEQILVDEKPTVIASKLNTLESAIDSKVIRGLPTIEDFIKELKDPKGKNKLSAEHILNMPARGRLDQRWHGGGLSSVSTDSTLTGDGTPSSPLHVVGGTGGASIASQGVVATQAGLDVEVDLTQLPNTATGVITLFRNGLALYPNDTNLGYTQAGDILTIYNADASEQFLLVYTYA